MPAERIVQQAARVRHIDAFKVMEVQRRTHELEAAGKRVIHMEIGQPDFGAPPAVVEAGVRALQTRVLGYTDALGLPELREALSRHYAEDFGVTVEPGRVVATAGASGALLLCLGALVNPGDEVLMADPGYPCYRHFVRLLDALPVGMPVDGDQHWQPGIADLERHWSPRTRGLILASPSNPSGSVIGPADLAHMAAWVRARGGFLIVDEIYLGLVYGDAPGSALAAGEDIFVINSFSKYFCMTGWRLGWAVVPSAHLDAVERLAQNLFICPSAPAQYAALAAFEPGSRELLDERREQYRVRRDWLVPRLRELGFAAPTTPAGAFYVYAGLPAEHADAGSTAFASRVLEQALVALTPGTDFGLHGAERHVRFAYTRPLEELQEGARRLQKFLRR